MRARRDGGGRGPAAERGRSSRGAKEGRNTFRLALRHAVVTAALLLVAGVGPAVAAAPEVLLTGLRCWSAPTATRVVLDFAAPVTPVAPDSGRASSLVVTVPGQPLPLPRRGVELAWMLTNRSAFAFSAMR